MRTEKDVEGYLKGLRRRYRAVDRHDTGTTFLVESSADLPAVAVRVNPPLVVVRVHVGDLQPAGNQGRDEGLSPLLRKLLELNGRQLLHTSYGLDGDHVVLSSALELENLDFNELQATLDEIDIALAQPLPELLQHSPASSPAPGTPSPPAKPRG